MQKRRFNKAANRINPWDILSLMAAVLCATFGLEGFLLPNNFLDGGVVGVALIIHALTPLPMPILLFGISLPFFLLGNRDISRVFALKAMVTIGALALALTFIKFPVITKDPLLIAVFGGFFLGLGIGFAIRGGGVIDGTEVLALYIAKRTPFTVGRIILIINVLIFLTAATVFSIEVAMYAMLTYLCASRTVDFVVHGLDDYTSMQIISKNASIIHKILKRTHGLDVTVLNAQKGDPSRPDKAVPQPILSVIVTRLQAQQVLADVQNIDPAATVIYHHVSDVHGRI
jgi:uncharacterized membrane-anchored protein YitT (DUF2179 family)